MRALTPAFIDSGALQGATVELLISILTSQLQIRQGWNDARSAIVERGTRRPVKLAAKPKRLREITDADARWPLQWRSIRDG